MLMGMGMRMGMGIGMGMRMRMRMRLHLNNSSAATTVCFYFILHIEFQCEMFFSLLFFLFFFSFRWLARMRRWSCVLFSILFRTFQTAEWSRPLDHRPSHCAFMFSGCFALQVRFGRKQGCLAALEALGFSIRQVASIRRLWLIFNPQTASASSTQRQVAQLCVVHTMICAL